jgi:hypothetical protein
MDLEEVYDVFPHKEHANLPVLFLGPPPPPPSPFPPPPSPHQLRMGF